MAAVARFLVPEIAKLFFVAEWTLFSVLFLVQAGRFETRPVVNLLLALAFFYLCGCGFVHFVRRGGAGPAGVRRLSLVALGLVALDHALKAWSYFRLPLGESVAVVPGILSFAHRENEVGSWFLATIGLGSSIKPASFVVELAILLAAPVVYRFYLHRHRRWRWPAVSYVCLAGGLLSFVIDLTVRGVVVDYIGLVGVVTADLKDVLLLFGAAAFVVEAVENPAISMRWNGWRGELRDFRELAGGFRRFIVAEWFEGRR